MIDKDIYIVYFTYFKLLPFFVQEKGKEGLTILIVAYVTREFVEIDFL